MKNIIKSFLETIANLQGEGVRIDYLLEDFNEYYQEFIENNPIGKAEQSIIDAIYQRATIGRNKYNTTTDREDYSTADWAQNMLEEILDKEVYKKVLLTNLQENLEDPLFLIKLVEFLKHNL